MSQNCGRPFAEALITGYLDGVISQGSRRRIGPHLRQCAACRRLFEDLREFRTTMINTVFHVHTLGSSPDLPDRAEDCLSSLPKAQLAAFLPMPRTCEEAAERKTATARP